MLGKSSFWWQRSVFARHRPARPRVTGGVTMVQRSAVRPRTLSLAIATLGVAFGCTSEDRQFGEPAADGGASSGETTSVDGGTDVDSVESSATGNETSASGTGTHSNTTSSSSGASSTETIDSETNPTGQTSDSSSSGTPPWNTTSEVSDATSDAPNFTSDDVSSDYSNGNTTTDETTSDPAITSDTSTPDETSDGLDFGVGEAPDYGNLGSGNGQLLVVNTLKSGEPVDVWLAGGERPILEHLSTETASRFTVTRGAQRVVFTRSGTHDVIGCSDWFPLSASEQWAVVPNGGDHTCSGSGDGSTSSFRQEQPLNENPIRFVHATRADRFSFVRNEQAEPGTLDAGGTLVGTSLPNCTSGCEVNYGVSASGVDSERPFTLQVSTAGDLPVAGEVMLIVLGDIREDWPAEADALRLLRVDLDGTTYVLQRDPEVAFGRLGDTPVTFSISTPPSSAEVAMVDPYCGEDYCPLEVRPWRTGRRTFFAEATEGAYDITVELEAGHRYVLLSTANSTYPLLWLEADFDRSQTTEAYVRGLNLQTSEQNLTFGAVFGDSASPIESLESVPWGEVSGGNGGQVPAAENTKIVTSDNPETLGTSCFYSVDFRAGYRGYLIESEAFQPLDVTAWPPTMGYAFMICI